MYVLRAMLEFLWVLVIVFGHKKARPFLQTTWQVWVLGGKLFYVRSITFNHRDFKHFLIYVEYQLQGIGHFVLNELKT